MPRSPDEALDHGDDRHGGDQSMALTRRRPRDWSRRSISL
jgi:hypothetical protein